MERSTNEAINEEIFQAYISIDDGMDVPQEYMDAIAKVLTFGVYKECTAKGVLVDEISVLLTSDEKIQELNKNYRKKDSPTDVLTFPIYTRDEIEEEFELASHDLSEHRLECLGDVVISLDTAILQAEQFGHGIIRELTFLTAHSFYHLLGFDHMTKEEDVEIRGMQKTLLEEIGYGIEK